MSKEGKTIILSMTINFVVSTIKLVSGIICHSKAMVADAFHSLSDFITDIIAFFGSNYSKKQPDNKHPDGYGRFEYIIDILIAGVILGLGVYTIVHSFHQEPIKANYIWLGIIIFSIILKVINSKLLMNKGIEYNSPILITSSKESHDDVIASLGVIFVIIISQFTEVYPILKYADTLCSLVIGALIIRTGSELLKENIDFLLGRTEENTEAQNRIKKIISEYEELEYKNIELERHGSYYVLELDVYVIKNIKVFKLIKIEEEISKKIKSLNYRIKFVDINLYHKTEKTTSI